MFTPFFRTLSKSFLPTLLLCFVYLHCQDSFSVIKRNDPLFFDAFPHSCVILSENRLRCWGANWYGQLGYGHTNTIGDDEAPVSAGDVDLGLDDTVKITQIAVGRSHTCALLG